MREFACANEGSIFIHDGAFEPCEIGLYTVSLSGPHCHTEYPILCGLTKSGTVLDHATCQTLLELPVASCSETGGTSPHWLKKHNRPHRLDEHVPKDTILTVQQSKQFSAFHDEIERMKQRVVSKKAALNRELNDLNGKLQEAELELESVTNDRLKRIVLQKTINQLRQEYMKRQENQFFDAMRLDMELEEEIKSFSEKEKVTVTIQREFVIQVIGNRQ